MRAVIIGSSTLGLMTAKILLKRGHEVVIIEKDKEKVQMLSESMDCGILHGDGSKPANLKETDPKQTDVLFCITGNDETNIIASLVGRSLGFARVVTGIEDPEFEHICIELGLVDTIIPARTIGRYLADLVEGRDPLELSTMIRSEARTFSFVAKDEDAVPISELKLPGDSRVICIYRSDELLIPEDDTSLKVNDEVIIITRRDNLSNLEDRWSKTN
ncbi:MAG: NAD-binding protein [Gammaproteobacteria bacterium]|jgi:trk system potassium uptake protein TrkA